MITYYYISLSPKIFNFQDTSLQEGKLNMNIQNQLKLNFTLKERWVDEVNEGEWNYTKQNLTNKKQTNPFCNQYHLLDISPFEVVAMQIGISR